MIIRKKYKFEAAHIVLNCASSRCSKNIHGHSFIVEAKITSTNLDDGDMIVDFGLLKDLFGEFVDWFDHSMLVWQSDTTTLSTAMMSNERTVVLPCNTTAENLSKIFFMGFSLLLENTTFSNGEDNVHMFSVKVHETATGYAECFDHDIKDDDWDNFKSHFKAIHVATDNHTYDVLKGSETHTMPEEV